MTFADQFAPHHLLADALLPHAFDRSDAAHDKAHLARVWRNVQMIRQGEGGDEAILAAATLLHDCVTLPKDDPDRASASLRSADRAAGLLAPLGWPSDRIAAVHHAIAAHSFSAGLPCDTLEARILQDADRLDALGHIGIARCFQVSGQLGRALYDPDDPGAEGRPPDDLTYALDHFETKLLRLADSFQTATGQRLARARHDTIRAFRDGLLAELGA